MTTYDDLVGSGPDPTDLLSKDEAPISGSEKGGKRLEEIEAMSRRSREAYEAQQAGIPVGGKVRKNIAHTALTQKVFSPLVIRKITKFGFPIYVALITDDDLDTLDAVIVNFVQEHLDLWKSDSIQDKRNLAGMLCDHLTQVYPKIEGAAVVLYIDKTCISSLFGDFMNHGMCRLELYSLLCMGTQV